MAQDIYKYTNPVTNETYTYSAVKGNNYAKAVAQAIEYCIATGDTDFSNVSDYIKKQKEFGNVNYVSAAKDAVYYVKDVYKVDTDTVKIKVELLDTHDSVIRVYEGTFKYLKLCLIGEQSVVDIYEELQRLYKENQELKEKGDVI